MPHKVEHPHFQDEYFTPLDDGRVLALLEEIRTELGGKWRNVAERARCSSRWLRMVRSGKIQTVSMTTMDRLLTRCGFGDRLADFNWYTPDELVKMGVWKPTVAVEPKRKPSRAS